LHGAKPGITGFFHQEEARPKSTVERQLPETMSMPGYRPLPCFVHRRSFPVSIRVQGQVTVQSRICGRWWVYNGAASWYSLCGSGGHDGSQMPDDQAGHQKGVTERQGTVAGTGPAHEVAGMQGFLSGFIGRPCSG